MGLLEAIRNNQPIYEMSFPNPTAFPNNGWGDLVAAGLCTNYPNTEADMKLGGFRAIALSPRSTVPWVPVIGEAAAGDYVRQILTAENPILVPMPITVWPNPGLVHNSIHFVENSDSGIRTGYWNTMLPVDGGAAVPFTSAQAEMPRLRVNFYLKDMPPLVGKRNPMVRGYSNDPGLGVGGADAFVRAYPVQGRKKLTLCLNNLAVANIADLRLTAIYPGWGAGGAPAVTRPNVEVQLAPAAGFWTLTPGGDDRKVIEIAIPTGVMFVALHGSWRVAVPAATSKIQWLMVAED